MQSAEIFGTIKPVTDEQVFYSRVYTTSLGLHFDSVNRLWPSLGLTLYRQGNLGSLQPVAYRPGLGLGL
jgi:hypothetical protein